MPFVQHHKYLLSVSSVPGTALDLVDTAGGKTDEEVSLPTGFSKSEQEIQD